MSKSYRVGEGWDRHRLKQGLPLRLAGVEVESDRGATGHSDGDVALHAVVDAMLGACGAGDIGDRYPPGDPRWKDADSTIFLEQTGDLLEEQGWHVVNLDMTIILEGTRLAPYRKRMEQNLEDRLPGSPPVNVKFCTAEKLGPVGSGKAVEARAVVLLESGESNST